MKEAFPRGHLSVLCKIRLNDSRATLCLLKCYYIKLFDYFRLIQILGVRLEPSGNRKPYFELTQV